MIRVWRRFRRSASWTLELPLDQAASYRCRDTLRAYSPEAFVTADNDSGANGSLNGAGTKSSGPTSGSDSLSGRSAAASSQPYLLEDVSALTEFLGTGSLVRQLQLLFGDRPPLAPPYDKGKILRALDREIAVIDALITGPASIKSRIVADNGKARFMCRMVTALEQQCYPVQNI